MEKPHVTGSAMVDQLARLHVPSNGLGIQYLGQHGYAVKYGSMVIYIDPFLSNYLEDALRGSPSATVRRFPPPLTPDDAINADYVICTHDHLDHLDPGTVPGLAAASPRARFIVPLASKDHLSRLGVAEERILGLRVDEDPARTVLGNGVEIIAIKATHDGFHYDPAVGHPYLGFVIRFPGVVLYHAGDTQVYDGLSEVLRSLTIDVAILPINGGTYRTRSLGFQGNMDVAEAADLGVAIEADWVIPSHYGMLSDNDEKVHHFVEYTRERYPYQKIHLLALGETVLYVKL